MTGEESKALRKAILVGHLSATVPTVAICAMAVGLFLWGPIDSAWGWARWVVAVVLCFFAGAWASIVTPRWRHWALRSGIEPEALYRWGRRTLLVSKKDSVFERAELYLSDGAFHGLLGALLVATFLTTETLLSEFLEGQLTLPSPIGALVAAGVSAAVLIPVHSSLRRLLKRNEEQARQLSESST